MHDSTKVLMGTTQSSLRKGARSYPSDPANFLAGKVVRLKSDGTLSLLKTDGQICGVSLGRDLADSKRTMVLPAGLRVPIRIDQESAQGTVTITSYANLVSGTDDAVTVNGTAFTAQVGAATLGQATFQAATSNNATAASLAAQINAHATTSLIVKAVAVGAVVTITALAGGTAGNAYTLTYTDNDSNIGATVSGATFTGGAAEWDEAAIGGAVYVSDTTGIATESGGGSTVTTGVYVSNAMTGIAEDGTEIKVALVDMQGGL